MDAHTFRQWQRKQFEAEREYARRILPTPKGSKERRQLLCDAYSDVIGNFLEVYDPGGGESNNSAMVAAVVKSQLTPRGKDYRNSKVFDLGCGGGNLISTLAESGMDVYGVDTSRDAVERAKQKLSKFAMSDHVYLGDFLDYKAPTKFDAIVMDNVIEHIVPDEIQDTLRRCHEMLKSGGILFVLTPHRYSGPHDISQHFLPLGSKAEGLHLREFSFADLNHSLLDAGYDDVMGFPVHPRLLTKFRVTPTPSALAARKCLTFEAIAERRPFRSALHLSRTLSRISVALLFPALAIGLKR